MKKYSQLQVIISVFMIFILLIQISGCVSSRIISSSEIPVSSKYYYKIHYQNSSYIIENIAISNGILTGKIDAGESSYLGTVVHLYLSSDSALIINPDKILSFPFNDISQVKLVKIATGKTILLVLGCTIVVLGLWFRISGPFVGI